jgi:hypothetical protein
MPICTEDDQFPCVLPENHPGSHRDAEGYERVRHAQRRCQTPGCTSYQGHPSYHRNSEGGWFDECLYGHDDRKTPPQPKKTCWERLLQDDDL